MECFDRRTPKGNAKHDRFRSELDFVIENMRQGLWRLDGFGIICYANPYLAEWLETDTDSMLGHHFSRYRSLRLVHEPKVQHSLSQRYEAEFMTRNGVIRRAIVVTSPTINEKGEPTGTVDLITDITGERAVQSKLTEDLERMNRVANTDPLTGASSRLAFDTRMRMLVQNAPAEPFGLIIVDLDHFKEINDTHGHDCGDIVLVEVATRIQSALRDGDIVARFGGDEFAVLLPGASKIAMAEVVARLEHKLTFSLPGGIHVSVSVGSSHSDEEVHAIFHAADQEMYKRKHARKSKSAKGIAIDVFSAIVEVENGRADLR
ncbi:MAG TPA: GGDEF domain-containing protein [Fimbriimonadaceae bacterium]|jgi:diguanylate cyclase (GGDEF)-like protein